MNIKHTLYEIRWFIERTINRVLNPLTYYYNQIGLAWYKYNHPNRTDVIVKCLGCDKDVAIFIGLKRTDVASPKRLKVLNNGVYRVGRKYSFLVCKGAGETHDIKTREVKIAK